MTSTPSGESYATAIYGFANLSGRGVLHFRHKISANVPLQLMLPELLRQLALKFSHRDMGQKANSKTSF